MFNRRRFFMEPDGGNAGGGTTPATEPQAPQTPPANQTTPEIDYDKLASIIAGKQSVAEDTVLKNYFKQQGLSAEDAKTAIAAFKEQKAANTPDVAALQTKNAELEAAVKAAALDKAVTLEAMGMGIDQKSLPYILKLADMSSAVKEDGTIDTAAVKTAIEQVLTDLPGLKPDESARGFQIGASGQDNQAANNQTTVPVATKRWNRFNN